MHITNFECKARVNDIDAIEAKLLTLNPSLHGEDHQIDTYFNVPHGRLKLRTGNIENALINYNRDNTAGAKLSSVILYPHTPHPALKEILTRQMGVLVIVDKKRKIYFIDNVKFHFDQVNGLGQFVEIEAIDTNGTFTSEQLQQQCEHYINFLALEPSMMIDISYSDMCLAQVKKNLL